MRAVTNVSCARSVTQTMRRSRRRNVKEADDVGRQVSRRCGHKDTDMNKTYSQHVGAQEKQEVNEEDRGDGSTTKIQSQV